MISYYVILYHITLPRLGEFLRFVNNNCSRIRNPPKSKSAEFQNHCILEPPYFRTAEFCSAKFQYAGRLWHPQI